MYMYKYKIRIYVNKSRLKPSWYCCALVRLHRYNWRNVRYLAEWTLIWPRLTDNFPRMRERVIQFRVGIKREITLSSHCISAQRTPEMRMSRIDRFSGLSGWHIRQKCNIDIAWRTIVLSNKSPRSNNRGFRESGRVRNLKISQRAVPVGGDRKRDSRNISLLLRPGDVATGKTRVRRSVVSSRIKTRH